MQRVRLLNAGGKEVLANARIERGVPEVVEDGEAPEEAAIETRIGIDGSEDRGLAGLADAVFVDGFAGRRRCRRRSGAGLYPGCGGRGVAAGAAVIIIVAATSERPRCRTEGGDACAAEAAVASSFLVP